MKLPRDVSGAALAKALAALGYEITRQTGSHLRLTTPEGGEHHVTIPVMPLCELERLLPFWMMWQHTSA
ncbi:MAG TPA: type II toxin-antitoxin system HicA family toxin [Pyrinomonadaceae bacterium]|jgi:predicted RNA binding protein YcfA (HicA-like mRNA interferase family)